MSVVVKATLVLVALTIFSKVSGFVREVAIAHQFGASSVTDAYLVAFTVPNLIFFIVSTSLATVVVPVYVEYSATGRLKEAGEVFSTVFNFLALLLAGFTAVGIFLAPLVVRGLAPGLPADAAALAAKLTAIMMPTLVFLGLGCFFNGLLNASNVFGLPAFGSVAMNLVIIAAALFGGKFYGIEGLAFGTVAGAVVMALVQVLPLRRTSFRYRFNFNLAQPGVRKVLRLIVPVIISVGVNQLYLIISRILASGLAEGSISALNYANMLILLPQGIFALALSTAIFPTLARQAAQNMNMEMARSLMRGVNLMLLLAAPAGLALMILCYPLVALLFQRGAFDARAVEMTSAALFFFAVGLAGGCLNLLLTRGFYALQDTRTPVLVTVATVAVNIIASLLFIGPLLHAGLALANSLAALFNAGVLLWLLHRRFVGQLIKPGFFRFCGSVWLASVIMAGALYWLDSSLGGSPSVGPALRVGLDILFGALVYLAALLLLRVEELGYLWHIALDLRQRLLVTRG